MKYTIYQITNAINGKIYIGCHKTDDINDGYMGSGKILHRAYEKYGVENFAKKILHIFDTSEEMFDNEMTLVDESFVARQDTYNIKEGGLGGWDHINDGSEKHKKRCSKAGKVGGPPSMKQLREHMQVVLANPSLRKEYGQKISKGLKNHFTNRDGYFKNMQHTKETKARIGAANAIHQRGKKNSQYGTCWIHNNNVSKKIEKDDLNEYLTEGWIKGRKIKF